MNIFHILINNPPAVAGTYHYDVRVYGYDNQWHKIYDGNVFVQAGQTSVNIELGDVLWNHRFTGENYISPAVNTTGDNFVMCDGQDTLYDYWFNSVQVSIPDLSASVARNVCFYNYNPFGNTCIQPNHDNVGLWMSHQPTPHIPSNPPAGFRFRQLVYNGSFIKGIDNTTTTVQVSKLGTILFTGGSGKYTINNTTVAEIDSCPHPYYLCWMTSGGGLQVQPFLKGSELSIKYDNNNRVDMSDFEWGYNRSVKATWKLRSGFLTNDDYKAYGEMFNSPYLILLDMENHKLHYVNVKDTTYNEKKRGSGGKSNSIYFEVNVSAAEIKTI